MRRVEGVIVFQQKHVRVNPLNHSHQGAVVHLDFRFRGEKVVKRLFVVIIGGVVVNFQIVGK
jgi:hypothetical protein